MNRDYILRLALVVKTGHSKFEDNLADVIAYTIYLSEESGRVLHVYQLKEEILRVIQIEFTENEIRNVIRNKPNLFCSIQKGVVSLTNEGRSKIKIDKKGFLDEVVNEFISIFDTDKKSEDVIELIHRFIYNSINSNIESLLNVINGKQDSSSLREIEKFNNDERKIINQFIDWENQEKNELLYRLVAFAVDYCRLTVKKDSSNFRTILQGKRFYLDANIIFRLMGINNDQRKKTTDQFIKKCNEVKIPICYTSVTKREILESIKYHVNIVKNITNGYFGSGRGLKKVSDDSLYKDDFLQMYIEWSSKNSMHRKYDEFEQYLKDLFYDCVEKFQYIEVPKKKLSEELVTSYINVKEGNIRNENAEYDVENVLFIRDFRGKKAQTIGWNVNEYLISADHKLVFWAAENISSENPIVVLPSVWYSIILKVAGRTSSDDRKAFSEFIKLRYVQNCHTENTRYLIETVLNKTSDGRLQDLLFDEICENSMQSIKTEGRSIDDVDKIVSKSYENVLEKVKKEGISEGHEIGSKEGFKSGVDVGKEIGFLNAERTSLEKDAAIRVKSTRKNNIRWTIFIEVMVLVGIYFIIRIIPQQLLADGKHIKYAIGYILPTGIVYHFISNIFPIEIKKIQEIEEAKIKPQLIEIDSKLKRLEEV